MRFIAIILIFSLFGCAPSRHTIKSSYYPNVEGQQLAQWKNMLGKWHGKQNVEDGGIHEWLVERNPDGTYQILFRITSKNGEINEKTEIGQWGSSGNIYFSIYRGELIEGKVYPSDVSDPTNYDAYYILDLTETEFEYKHARTQDQFKVKRVPKSYKLD